MYWVLTMHIRLSLTCLVFNLCLCTLVAAEPMIVRYQNSGQYDAHNAFQFELIHMALDITRAEFGDHQIKPYTSANTAKRQAILLAEGKLMNMHWASPGTPIAQQTEVIQVPFNILQGLLGYRICLINQESRAQFATIDNLNDLRQIRIGQGQDWTDTRIYHHNQIPVMEAPGLENLFPILASDRFDCLALGLNEVQFKYRQEKQRFKRLMIEPHLLLYYDFPTYLYVSRSEPRLAERMTRGLQLLETSGAFSRLFNHYFAADLAQLNLDKRKIICLKSPYLAQTSQCETPINIYPGSDPNSGWIPEG